MKIGSSTTRPIFAQLLCHDQGPSLQQRRLKKTQVELASSSQLWTLLDELEALPRESNNIQHEKTELSLGLPLSPLMDTNLISARERHRLPKPKLDKEKAPDLEKKLLMNPYAQTLASPIRHCGMTGVRLPREFLLNFGVVKHPETGRSWHYPVLAKLPSQKRLPEANIDNRSSEPRSNPKKQDSPPPPPTQALASENPILELATGIAPPEPLSKLHEQSSSPPTPKVSITSKYPTGNYYLSSHSVMKELSTTTRDVLFRTLPPRWKLDQELKWSNCVWRQDMHAYIETLLRKHAFKTLKFAATSHTSHLVGDSPDMPLEFMSAALWLGKPESPLREDANPCNHEVALDEDDKGRRTGNHRLSSSAMNQPTGPPPYAMIPQPTGYYMPIYNLPVLMRSKNMQELRTVSRVFGGEMVYIRKREKTVAVQMALWKLMGYMNSDGEGEGVGKWGGGKGAGRKMWREKKAEAARRREEGNERAGEGKIEERDKERKAK